MLELAYSAGIADWFKYRGKVCKYPAWMDAAEKKVWNKGRRYALRQQA